VASAEDLLEDGGKPRGFSRVCICDAKRILGTLWDSFQQFVERESEGALSTTVAYGSGPALLVRRVEPGEKMWPVLQEGQT